MSPKEYEETGKLAESGIPEKVEAATRACNDALDENPNDAPALYLLGFILLKAEKPGLAFQVLKRASEIVPGDPSIWHNLGKCCMDMKHIDNAEKAWKEAVRLDPKWANSLDGLGLISLRRGDFAKTIEYCDRSLELVPEMMDSMVNRGMAYLALRRWKEGWEGYTRNLGQNKDRKEIVFSGELRWDGTKGLKLVCRGEQGVGDEINFASCLPDLIKDSESVVLECDRRLEGLFRRSFNCDVFGTRYKDVRPWVQGYKFDARVALGDLPKFYRNTTESFPGTPYLKASEEMRLQWRALLDSLGKRPKIGIAWTGGITETGKERRSIRLETLLPILRHDADFVSLEYKDPREEILSFEETHGIKINHWSWGVEAYDYDQSVALIAELDLVISVTTTVVNVCGSIGKECWVLVPEKPIWMFGVEGDFVWAKSVKLFRQKGSWPIQEIASKLKERYASPSRQQQSSFVEA